MNRAILLAALLISGCAKRVATALPPGPLQLEEPLPFDPGITAGVMKNGMRYYIEPNAVPHRRAVFRLVVDAGSALEDDDQLGLAHVVEHMAFNGTENFPGNELVTYLESIGAQFGPHLNAHTGFEETVYKLEVPTDDPVAFSKALQMVEDWAHAVTFDPKEIDAERPVVLEEWRTRLGLAERMQEELMPLMYAGSRYLERTPIGTEESLRTFEHEALKRFYRDWYRPDNMALAVVGHVDARKLEKRLIKQFADWEPSENPRERTRFELPDQEGPLSAVVVDAELPATSGALLVKHRAVEGATIADYKQSTITTLTTMMLNERLGSIAQQPGAPFLGGGAARQRISPTTATWALGVGTPNGQLLPGLEAALTELRRAQVHGFSEAELERAKQRQANGLTRYLKERENTHSNEHIDEIVRHITLGETMPGTQIEVDMAMRLMPTISLADVNDFTKNTWFSGPNVILQGVMPPGTEENPTPTKQDLLDLWSRVSASTPEPPAAEAEQQPLLEPIPEPGEVTSTDDESGSALGFTQWTLSNGVKVWWRATAFKADEIRVGAFSNGGHSLVDEEHFVAAQTATSLMNRSGLGPHDAITLGKQLAGQTLRLNHNLGETGESVTGLTSPDDLETLMQLIWLSFHQPRFDESAFEVEQSTMRAVLADRSNSLDAKFNDHWKKKVWANDPRELPWTTERVDQMSLEQSERIFNERFGNAADFDWVFIGNIEEESFRALVERYIATLPAEPGPREEYRDLGYRPDNTPFAEQIEGGAEARATVRIQYHGEFPETSRSARQELTALGDIASVQLREALREDLGGVYGVNVSASSWEHPYPYYTFRVSFQCDPTRKDELIAATESVLDSIREEIKEEWLTSVQEKYRRSRQTAETSNEFWLSKLANTLQAGEDPDVVNHYIERVDALTTDQIKAAADRFLVKEQRSELVMVPKSE